MITRRARFVLPATLALGAFALPAASAVVPPYTPVGVDEPLVVAEAATMDGRLYGLEVSARTITWGAHGYVADTLEEVPGPITPALASVREYTPDLGKAPLTLGSAAVPAVSHALSLATTPEWVVGFDPYVSTGDGEYTLRVRHDGGPETLIGVGGDVSPWSGGIAVWGDTALAGPYAVNLNTGDVFDLQDECAMDRPVLADGLLLVRNACEGQVIALEVPADGITAAALESSWNAVLDEVPDLMAYSQGLLVFGYEFGSSDPDADSEVGYLRLGDRDADTWRRPLEGYLGALRVQGHRFVAVTGEPESDTMSATVLEEGQLPDGAPLAVVEVAGQLRLSDVVVPDGPAARTLAPVDPTSEMNLDMIPVDLYGRTLAWFDGARIVAATLPALSGGAVTSTAPASAKVGAPVTVTAAGLLPGEEVAVWMESDPALLTLGRAGADGSFSASVTLPATATAGTHTLTVHGVESGWSSARTMTLAAAGNTGLRIDTGR